MNRYKFLVFSLAFFLSSNLTAQTSKSDRPNIIFILADDLGYGDVGFNGQKLIRTPNIDRLAAEGIKFSQFYAGTSVCSPSRSSMMSGKHSGHTYIRGNKAAEPEGQYPIADSVITVAEVLSEAGYRTGAFGKWGLGQVGSQGDPNKQGFDSFYGYNCQTLAHRYYPNHLWDNQRKIILEENQNLRYNKQYAPDLIQKKALEYIQVQEKGKPFFLFLPYILPHAELIVPDDSLFLHYKGKFPEKAYKGADYGAGATKGGYASQQYPHAAFAAMVARLDLYVGQVLAKLKEKGIDENTLVIFTSDNGPHIEGGADPAFFNSGGGYRGGKRDLYEGGMREPFAARWPAVIKPGKTSNYLGAFWDILPTFAELAKAKTPENLDGISFAATLSGIEKQKKHSYLYWELHEQGGKQAVRVENWKGVLLDIEKVPNGKFELYNLSKDPAEKNDLSAQYPDKVSELRKIMNEAHVESAIFPFELADTN